MTALYIDSADRVEVTRLLATGLFAGVTTNPAILDKAGLGSRDVPDVVAWAVDAGATRVFAQVWGSSVAELVDRAAAWRALSPRVVVKVAYSAEGLHAARILAETGEVLVTGVHAAVQVVPVIASGAAFVAPFVARMDAAGRPGLDEVVAMQRAVDGGTLEVLAGSLRTPEQVLALAAAGIRNVTFGPPVWDLFFADPVTRAAVADLERLAAGEPVAA